MYKLCLSLMLLASAIGFAQYTGKVGINTESPSQTLDVNGTQRVRDLLDGSSTTDYPYYVVAQEDGTLGKITYEKRNEQERDDKLKLAFSHIPTGLNWNTRDGSAVEGTQGNFNNYVLFGTKHPTSELNNVTSSTYTSTKATTFSAKAGDFITFSYLLKADIFKNYQANTQLDTTSDAARKIKVFLFIYKGNTIVDKQIKDVAFNGPNDLFTKTGTLKSLLSSTVSFNYKIPDDGKGDDYSATILVSATAPSGNMFRIHLSSYEQILYIYSN